MNDIESLKAQLFNKFIIFKNRIARIKREKLTLKQRETNEMFEELVQKCEKRYGINLEDLGMKASFTQMKELDKFLGRYIQELEKIEQEAEEAKTSRSQDISTYMNNKGADISKKLKGTPIANTEMTSNEYGTKITVDPESLRIIKEDEERE